MMMMLSWVAHTSLSSVGGTYSICLSPTTFQGCLWGPLCEEGEGVPLSLNGRGLLPLNDCRDEKRGRRWRDFFE